MPGDRQREIEITERSEIPWLSVVLGYGPMAPIIAGAFVAWFGPGTVRKDVIALTLIYAASILAFLAGVRRGLSFRTASGPSSVQIATMAWLYLTALGALLGNAYGHALMALAFLVAGFATILILDPMAAQRAEAPLFFARLRVWQMLLALAGLVALAADLWLHG